MEVFILVLILMVLIQVAYVSSLERLALERIVFVKFIASESREVIHVWEMKKRDIEKMLPTCGDVLSLSGGEQKVDRFTVSGYEFMADSPSKINVLFCTVDTIAEEPNKP